MGESLRHSASHASFARRDDLVECLPHTVRPAKCRDEAMRCLWQTIDSAVGLRLACSLHSRSGVDRMKNNTESRALIVSNAKHLL